MDLSYNEQWRMLRVHNRAAILGFVLGLLAIVPVAVLVSRAIGVRSAFVLLAVAAVWVVIWGFLSFRVTRFRFPRCRQRYFSHHGLFLLTNPRNCASCGLKLYAEA